MPAFYKQRMNYRHAYHAGNFADVVKHAVLIALLNALRRKDTPFSVLDTHAGVGLYDLSGVQAQATGEWRDGIGRLEQCTVPLPSSLRELLTFVKEVSAEQDGKLFYPGSPEITARMLRPGDSLVCCELHPDDQRSLKRLFRNRPGVSVHGRNGYEAVGALLPPRNARRGLVLMDPPFEQKGEFGMLAEAIIAARHRFPAGIVAAWYPIKHRAPARAFFNVLKDAGQRDLLAVELTVRPPLDPTQLNGCGILIARPPFRFEEEARDILSALAGILGEGTTETSVEWVVPE